MSTNPCKDSTDPNCCWKQTPIILAPGAKFVTTGMDIGRGAMFVCGDPTKAEKANEVDKGVLVVTKQGIAMNLPYNTMLGGEGTGNVDVRKIVVSCGKPKK